MKKVILTSNTQNPIGLTVMMSMQTIPCLFRTRYTSREGKLSVMSGCRLALLMDNGGAILDADG